MWLSTYPSVALSVCLSQQLPHREADRRRAACRKASTDDTPRGHGTPALPAVRSLVCGMPHRYGRHLPTSAARGKLTGSAAPVQSHPDAHDGPPVRPDRDPRTRQAERSYTDDRVLSLPSTSSGPPKRQKRYAARTAQVQTSGPFFSSSRLCSSLPTDKNRATYHHTARARQSVYRQIERQTAAKRGVCPPPRARHVNMHLYVSSPPPHDPYYVDTGSTGGSSSSFPSLKSC